MMVFSLTSPSASTSRSECVPHRPPSSLLLTIFKSESWFATLARSSVLSLFKGVVRSGYLRVEHAEGIHEFGSPNSKTSVHLKVVSENFWMRMLQSAELGFSEAYMVGEIEVDNLRGVMDLWLDNRSTVSGLYSNYNRLATVISGLCNAFFGQTRTRARLNVIASYDQSNELFKAFLSQEMMYSCALWGESEGGVRGDLITGPTDGDLEAAQMRKIHHVLKKARVKHGHRILEIGTGWGALAIEAARSYGCEVDTITLSKEQKALAEERIKAAGLEDCIRVHLMDYRDIPSHFEKSFDAFISIEMLEHVGAKHYHKYFKLVDFALKPQNATVVVSASTFPESHYSAYQSEDFLRRYMWPNSCLPSATALIEAVRVASQDRFTLDGVENHAAHYPRTLRTWDRRLKSNIQQDVIAQTFPALMDPGEFKSFMRKWGYFFTYAGAGFAKGYITCHMLTFIRENDWPIACD